MNDYELLILTLPLLAPFRRASRQALPISVTPSTPSSSQLLIAGSHSPQSVLAVIIGSPPLIVAVEVALERRGMAFESDSVG